MIGKQISFRIICILSLVILGTQCWVMCKLKSNGERLTIKKNRVFQRPFKIEITNLSTYSLVNYMESNSSISKQNSVSIYINVLKYLTEIYAKVTVIITSANGNYSSVLFNKTIDCCEFLKNPKYEPIVQVFYRALTINGSFPKNCPITKVRRRVDK